MGAVDETETVIFERQILPVANYVWNSLGPQPTSNIHHYVCLLKRSVATANIKN